jgi:ribosomal protein S18 acetylase RimI-like enzyme
VDIHRAAPAELSTLATTLADAFADDPVWSWMIPPRRRQGRLRLLFAAVLRHALTHGTVDTTGTGDAVALWSPPGEWRLPTVAQLRAAPAILLAAGPRLPRLLGRLADIEAAHATQPRQHWYLEFIGVRTAAQGRGLGSGLLRDALARFDREGVPVYLESSNPRNLPFYHRHGFQVTGELTVRAGPAQWTLWRPAH